MIRWAASNAGPLCGGAIGLIVLAIIVVAAGVPGPRYMITTPTEGFMTNAFVEKDGCVDFNESSDDKHQHVCGAYTIKTE